MRVSIAADRVYSVRVERDQESGWLVGEVTELPGCYTQAPNISLLRANLREAIAGYLAVAESKGRAGA